MYTYNECHTVFIYSFIIVYFDLFVDTKDLFVVHRFIINKLS